jgi:hypothetical protein
VTWRGKRSCQRAGYRWQGVDAERIAEIKHFTDLTNRRMNGLIQMMGQPALTLGKSFTSTMPGSW